MHKCTGNVPGIVHKMMRGVTPKVQCVVVSTLYTSRNWRRCFMPAYSTKPTKIYYTLYYYTKLWYISAMSSMIRDFLEIPKVDIGEMTPEQLAMEVEGWRAVMGTLPPEVMQWLARMHEMCRFTLRNNQGHAGILIGVKFEAKEFTVYEQALAFDPILGNQVVEDKEVVIPSTGVSFIEFINDKTPYSRAAEDREIAEQNVLG